MAEDRLEAFGIYKMAQQAFDDFWADSEIVGKDYRGREPVKQQVRSLDSVCANIEEGHGRGFNKEMPQHLKIARGEARESKGSDTHHPPPVTRNPSLTQSGVTMSSNPILQKLDYSPDTRLVITHGDDIGMCHASIQAYEDLYSFGTLKSGAVMVPCPWFPAAAAMQQRNPAYDLGVHLTLTSEWSLYRWRPLTAGINGSSLLDGEGYFPCSESEVQARAEPEEAGAELLAQVQRALQFGIDVTHVDTHMGAVAHPKFIPAYIQLATQFQVPPFIPRGDVAMYMSFGMGEDTAQFLVMLIASLEEQGIVLVDSATGLPLDEPNGQLEVARKMFAELKPGLTHFIIHPSVDTPELRAITPDWECRVANYNLLKSDAFQKLLEAEDVKLIGYREIREAMRRSSLP